MGAASLVIVIISLIVSIIPMCNFMMILPAVAGLILGIADVAGKSKAGLPKGMSIAGIILNSLSFLTFIFANIIYMQVMAQY